MSLFHFERDFQRFLIDETFLPDLDMKNVKTTPPHPTPTDGYEKKGKGKKEKENSDTQSTVSEIEKGGNEVDYLVIRTRLCSSEWTQNGHMQKIIQYKVSNEEILDFFD
jgi:hypothetical protein